MVCTKFVPKNIFPPSAAFLQHTPRHCASASSTAKAVDVCMKFHAIS